MQPYREDSKPVTDINLLLRNFMTDRTLYLKCKRCHHESMLSAELMNKILTMIPGETIHSRRLYLDQNRHRLKCSQCSNKDLELVLETEKIENISPSPDLHPDTYCDSCGGVIEKERLSILPDTKICGNCAQSVITLSTEGDPDIDHKSWMSGNSGMVLILPHIGEHRVKPHV